jgi:predicted nucleic acid-binding protein
VAFVALLDANVLHPISLCDVLLRLAEKGLFQPRWSDEILNETLESIVRQHAHVARQSIGERIEDMRHAFPDAMVHGYQTLRDALDAEMKDDAHVLAAAVVGKADLIVTNNLRDFAPVLLRRYDLDAQSADTFLVNQWWLDPTTVTQVLAEMAYE